MYSLFYTSPIDAHGLAGWPPCAAELERSLRAALGSGVEIELGERPVIGYGTELASVVASMDAEPRGLRLDLWTSIVFHASIRVSLGEGVDPGMVRSALGDLALLDEHPELTPGSARLRAYDGLPSPTGRRQLTDQFADPVYLGSKHCGLFDENEQVWDGVELVKLFDGDVAAFRLLDAESERDFWNGGLSPNSDGLILLDGDDPAFETLVRHFHDLNDMSLLLSRREARWPRVTIGRCHMDDAFLCLFDSGVTLPPSNELLFFL